MIVTRCMLALLMCLLLRKIGKKILSKKVRGVFLGVVVIIILTVYMLPIENLFVSFPSPEFVYKYCKFANSEDYEVALVVDGMHSSLVVGLKDGYKHNNMIVPKKGDKWKIGSTLDTEVIRYEDVNNTLVEIIKYRGVNDYYICVDGLDVGELEVSDSNESHFDVIERESVGELFYSYHTYTSDIDGYYLTVNGEKIEMQTQKDGTVVLITDTKEHHSVPLFG